MKQVKLSQLLQVKHIQDSVIFFVLGCLLLGYSLVGHYSDVTVGWELSPYLFPALVAVFIVALAVSLCADGLHHLHNPHAGDEPADPHLPAAVVIIIAAVCYCLLLPLVTFIPATLAFMVFAFWYLGERRIWLVALLSLCTTLSVYVIFDMLLGVMLP